MNIAVSHVLHHPKIVWTILKNTPTLDPLVIIMNAPVIILYQGKEVIGFLTIKKFGSDIELGTIFIYPQFRGHKHGEKLFDAIKGKYPKIYLLCKPDIVPIYERYGFSIIETPPGIIGIRKKLFNWFLKPLTGYTIVAMEN